MDTSVSHHWDLLARWLKDADALAFCRALNELINVWDDLIDLDAPAAVTPENIHSAFTAALVDIPRNPFYQRWRAELQPAIEIAIANWRAANDMEVGTAEDATRAHVLRFSGIDVFVMCVRILHGFHAATNAALELRRAIPGETLADFLEERHGS